jgi:hypothetical protein
MAPNDQLWSDVLDAGKITADQVAADFIARGRYQAC